MKTLLTHHKMIVAMMIRKENQEWWHAEDLMQQGELFVGYKAQARISELALKYPEMIERKPSNKGNRQHMYRFRFENTPRIFATMPDDWKRFLREEFAHSNITYSHFTTVYEEVRPGVVRPVQKLMHHGPRGTAIGSQI